MDTTTHFPLREEQPTHHPEIDRLAAFAGEWQVEGRGPGLGNVSGHESFSMFNGGFFLVYRWDRHAGGKRHTGLGFIGHDTVQGRFLFQSCDNLGYARTYEVAGAERSFTLTGDYERGKVELSADGQKLSIHWEQRREGKWLPLCDLKGWRTH